jgi:YbbR domain-containing protein
VNVEISSPSKELPIKVIPKGNVAFGKAISTIKTSETKATVYGEASSLEELNYIPVEIDVTDLAKNTEYKLEVPKPVGVKSMNVNNITVNISLDNVSDKDIDNVAIETKNLGTEYKVSAVSSEDSFVQVNVKGVSSVIDQITADNITAYIDLQGYTEGEYEVDVNVEGTDLRVEYVSKTKKVKVKITKK